MKSELVSNGTANAYLRKSLFASCFYTFFVNGGLALILGAILPYMKNTYDLNYKIVGMLISIHSVGNLISSFMGGVLPVYIGRKKSIVLLSSTGVVAFVLMTLTGNPVLLLFAFFLTGISRGAVSNFNNTMVNEIATGEAWALNLLHSVFAIGAFIAPFIALFFVKDNPNGWKYAALTLAFFCLTEVLTYAFMNIPNNKHFQKEKKKMEWGFLKNKYYLTACAILFFYLCAEQAINGWLVTYFKESGILSGSIAQSMSALLWIVILFGRLLTAYLSKKMKKTSLLLISACGYVVFFVILILSRTIIPVTISIVGVGFCMSGLYPTTVASTGNIIKEYPMGLSFLLTFAGLGAILMPTIIGTIADHIGIIGGMSTVIIAVIITLLFIIYNAYLYKDIEEI